MKGSEWRAERNYRSLERLERALPQIFPKPVLIHALARPLVPPLPRLAIDSYWRSHPLLADRLARALAAKTGAPPGWTWTVSGSREPGLGTTFHAPPAPYREAQFKLGPGRCCVCGQLVYRFGWHVDLWKRGPNRNVEWHAACVAAWRLWAAPRTHLQMLKRLQLHRCAETGKRLSGGAEVDHRIPLRSGACQTCRLSIGTRTLPNALQKCRRVGARAPVNTARHPPPRILQVSLRGRWASTCRSRCRALILCANRRAGLKRR